jgi:peptide/nickel transport system permease protein
MGASTRRIFVKHLFPGVVNTVVVLATLLVGNLILTESVLSFLGAGVPPPRPAWGSMISEGREFLSTAWWIATFPGIAIVLTVLGFNFLGDWLRDFWDPRLRQSR